MPSNTSIEKASIPCENEIESPTRERHHDRTPLDPNSETRLLRKCDLHLIPILFGLYLFAFMDRINIGNAKIQGLQKELNMNGTQYNVALLTFFPAYVALEVPANILMRKIRPSTWLSTLMFSWGVVTICQGLVHSYGGLVACRVLLGALEAGVLPGCIYLISMYYKRSEMQKRYTAFFTSAMVAGAFAGLLAFALAKMNGLGGYSGWRWIFIIEGLATIVYSVSAKLFIPDWPEQCRFLTPEEKVLMNTRLAIDNASEEARMDRLDNAAIYRILKDWKIWVGSVNYFVLSITGYSSLFFIPYILNQFGWDATEAQLHTIPVYIVSAATTLLAAYLSDRLRHRYTFLMIGTTFNAIAYIILLCQGPPNPHGLPRNVRYMAIFFALIGQYISTPMVIVWLSNNLSGHYKRAIGMAIQVSIGNAGGIAASNIYLQSETPIFKTGYGTALAMVLASGFFSTVFYLGLKWENRQRVLGKRDWRLELRKEERENLGDDHPSFRLIG
ncbi:MFS general substrate transporter [Zopfia rhizophila CBS 207.26]|uniref:MFS general substrate transporter n=1 Tax=Zopfia rhizophila CBS 207.26 TaxID=1314779 RepID=A0A6A6E1W2_9PEZI|nr:MFS general substrate transporter [Zopfia rhizophila CBS 207.26]